MGPLWGAIARASKVAQILPILGIKIREFWNFVQDGLLPPQCLSCGAGVASAQGLCGDCWRDLGLRDRHEAGPAGIWGRAQGAVLFEEKSRRLIHGLKYHDRFELAGLMVRLMVQAGQELVSHSDLLVPVPLHRRRLWARRFNQAALLTQKIAKQTEKPWSSEILYREKATGAQVGLSARARRGNIAGAFHVAESQAWQIKNKRILLIDDVMTTGSTAGEAVHCLLRAGARNVDVLVFALVAEPFRSHIHKHG
jgi:ComF family protein